MPAWDDHGSVRLDGSCSGTDVVEQHKYVAAALAGRCPLHGREPGIRVLE
jgi:hypothetical protein